MLAGEHEQAGEGIEAGFRLYAPWGGGEAQSRPMESAVTPCDTRTGIAALDIPGSSRWLATNGDFFWPANCATERESSLRNVMEAASPYSYIVQKSRTRSCVRCVLLNRMRFRIK